MLHPTSLEAYQEVRPKIPGKHLAVLLWMKEHRELLPATAQEISQHVHCAWKRLSELERAGLVRRVAMRFCKVTSRHAVTWEPVWITASTEDHDLGGEG